MGITKLLIVKAKKEKKGVENELLPSSFLRRDTHNWRPRIDIDGGPLYFPTFLYEEAVI